MLVDVSVPEQVESKLRRKAATQGQDLGEYLQRVIVEAAEDDLPTPPAGENTAEYMARLRAMIARHAVRCGHVDDSRESIYEVLPKTWTILEVRFWGVQTGLGGAN